MARKPRLTAEQQTANLRKALEKLERRRAQIPVSPRPKRPKGSIRWTDEMFARLRDARKMGLGPRKAFEHMRRQYPGVVYGTVVWYLKYYPGPDFDANHRLLMESRGSRTEWTEDMFERLRDARKLGYGQHRAFRHMREQYPSVKVNTVDHYLRRYYPGPDFDANHKEVVDALRKRAKKKA